jgi:prolyl-tRNA editing enzyme YbaK/EbsC (Cys-tRNA(Pro) deacylase)
MSISTRLKGFLDENQIPYSVMTHATAYTAQGAAATMQMSGKELAKTVVLWTGEEKILAVLPVPNHVKLDVSSLIASWVPCRLSALFTTCLCT